MSEIMNGEIETRIRSCINIVGSKFVTDLRDAYLKGMYGGVYSVAWPGKRLALADLPQCVRKEFLQELEIEYTRCMALRKRPKLFAEQHERIDAEVAYLLAPAKKPGYREQVRTLFALGLDPILVSAAGVTCMNRSGGTHYTRDDVQGLTAEIRKAILEVATTDDPDELLTAHENLRALYAFLRRHKTPLSVALHVLPPVNAA